MDAFFHFVTGFLLGSIGVHLFFPKPPKIKYFLFVFDQEPNLNVFVESKQIAILKLKRSFQDGQNQNHHFILIKMDDKFLEHLQKVPGYINHYECQQDDGFEFVTE